VAALARGCTGAWLHWRVAALARGCTGAWLHWRVAALAAEVVHLHSARRSVVQGKVIMRLLLVFLVTLLGAGSASAACSVRQRTVIPIEDSGGVILVPLQVNGLDATFILDTGAERSVTTPAAIARLGLRLDEWVGTTMRGVGGVEAHRNADPRSMTLGGVLLQRHTLSHDASLTVGTLPRTRVGNITIDGLLGRDFLAVFDLDLDLPRRTLTLYDVNDCGGRFLPWTGSYASVPVSNPMEYALVAQVAVDGTPLRALIDTGASSSIIGAPGMVRLGVPLSAISQDPGVTVSGLGPRMVIMRRHRFQSLRVDGETVRDPELWVAPVRFTPIVDMLLGADWLAGKRVWISFATHQVFVAGT
jgi:hypothetical protein